MKRGFEFFFFFFFWPCPNPVQSLLVFLSCSVDFSSLPGRAVTGELYILFSMITMLQEEGAAAFFVDAKLIFRKVEDVSVGVRTEKWTSKNVLMSWMKCELHFECFCFFFSCLFFFFYRANESSANFFHSLALHSGFKILLFRLDCKKTRLCAVPLCSLFFYEFLLLVPKILKSCP